MMNVTHNCLKKDRFSTSLKRWFKRFAQRSTDGTPVLQSLEPRLYLDSTVVFNEVMYHPSAEEASGVVESDLEWVELFNQLRVDMDLSEWSLEGDIDFTFPDGTVIPGGGYLVIAKSPSVLSTETGFPNAIGPFMGNLSNGGGEIRLINNDGRTMNVIDYDDQGDWPVGADGGGVALAKRDPKTATEDSRNWTTSLNIGGTPGVSNFGGDTTVITQTILPSNAPVSVFIPPDNSLNATWFNTSFDDSSWIQGTSGVGYEDSAADYQGLINTNILTTWNQHETSLYTRFDFTVNQDPADFDQLILKMKYDDGFVAYLNGQEVARSSTVPAGTPTYNTRSSNHSDSEAVSFKDFNITGFANLLVQGGNNVLAVHGLNQASSSSDMLILPELESREVFTPEEQAASGLIINEIAPHDDPEFFVEIFNESDVSVNLEGFVIEATGNLGGVYTFGAQAIGPGQYLAVSGSELGFVPDNGAKLFMYTSEKEMLVDAQVIDNDLRGLSDRYDRTWLYPASATPGAENVFAFEDSIVINEIMYHMPPNMGSPGVPPTFEVEEFIAIDENSLWRYNETGNDLGQGWAQNTHPVDNSIWFEGPALIGYEIFSNRPEPLRTQITNPRNVDPYPITHYFETDFEFDSATNPFDSIQLNHIVDDGAIFYLNGVEFHRFNMPAGPVTATTLASSRIEGDYVEPINIPMNLLIDGTNRLSVELHQESDNSNDVIFGATVSAQRLVDPGIEALPFHDNEEEWIELYNKGNQPVDLTGWTIDRGIDFEFEAGTVIQPGEYLVVSNNKRLLEEKYPAINIVGDFNGTLSNSEDRISLIDANRNPVDDVEYFEGGRWDAVADGGGSSLELKNPTADNSIAEAWSASDESDKSEWFEYTYTGIPGTDLVSSFYEEFIFGLLDSGEFLIDDISVILRPGVTNQQMIQNGDFESDVVGQSPASWRLIGNHFGTVVNDPTDPGNQVLHVTAYGAQAHVHDHAETTFVNNTPIDDSAQYEISYRVKWLNGNRQLNSRLYYTRLSNTAVMPIPDNLGTPGAQNSNFETNIGPTYTNFQHGPVIPAASEPVTVTVQAQDPDGVANMTLRWNVNGGTWNNVAMTLNADGVYTGTIPGQSNGVVVQFYVQGVDTQGAMSTFPAAGEDSRALYQVVSNEPDSTRNVETIRLILLPQDNAELFSAVNRMSNHFRGATMIRSGTEVFYDVAARQVGSRFIRPNSGYKIKLNSDQKFYDIHSSVRIDMNGLSEIIMKQMINRAGGSSVSMYDDLSSFTSPQHGTRTVLLNLARYDDVFLEEQFENGGDGTKWELDDITYPTNPSPSPEGLKTGTGVSSQDILYRGDNPEAYRGQLLIKNNRAKDDFQSIVDFAYAINRGINTLFEETMEVMDVDIWMRHYATQSWLGNWDTYGFRRPKNLRIYTRPDDNKMIPLAWDFDLANLNEPLVYNGGISRLDDIRNIPHNFRLFWGHMWDIMNRSFNPTYATSWANHYNSLGGGTGGLVNTIANRYNSARSEILSTVPQLPFEITTNNGNPVTVSTPTATISGNGWIDVKQIKIAGTGLVLEPYWDTMTGWEAQVPLAVGENNLVFEAYDYEGNLIGSQPLTVTSTDPNRALQDHLRVTELMYHPVEATTDELNANPTFDSDDAEFIELMNTSDSLTLDLTGVVISDGIDFTFESTSLAPGQRVVIVKDLSAFNVRHDSNGMNIAGEYERSLSDGGERILISDSFGSVISDFTYDDSNDWPARADGNGPSIEVLDVDGDYSNGNNWRNSYEYHGSPDIAGIGSRSDVVINEVLAHTDLPQSDTIELHNTTDAQIDVSGWWLSDAIGDVMKFQIPAGSVIPAGGYLTFDESDFNPTPLTPGENDFALSSEGDDVWLLEGDLSGRVLGFADRVSFEGSLNGVSFGRFPNGTGDLYPMSELTLGAQNTDPRVGEVIISEVMYAPTDAGDSGLTLDELEFVELYHRGNNTESLESWEINGAGFAFGPGVEIAPGEVMVIVSFDPLDTARADAFRSIYNIDSGVQLVGPFTGRLDNSGETLTLLRAEQDIDEQTVKLSIEDQIDYQNIAPWPVSPATGGDSLNRTADDNFGNHATSWEGALPTPGSVDLEVNLPGDFDGDENVDADDIDLLTAAIRNGSSDMQYDLNGDNQVDDLDLTEMIEEILGTSFGDANLDKKVDLEDLAKLATNFGQSGQGWADGNFTSNDIADLEDLAKLATNFGIDLSGGGAATHETLANNNAHGEALYLNSSDHDADSSEMSWNHIGSLLNDSEEGLALV